MKLRIAWIGRTRSSPIQSLTAEYLKRLSRYAACDAQELTSEAALLKLVEKSTSRKPPVLVLLDARGRQLTSEEIANFLLPMAGVTPREPPRLTFCPSGR